MKTKPFLITTAVVLACLVAGCSKKANQEVKAAAPEAPVVKIAEAQQRTIEKSIFVTGSLAPDETVSISSEAAGRVLKINYDFGQYVKKGETIAVLDAREYDLQLQRVKAALSQALARMGMDPNADPSKPPVSTAGMRQMEAQMDDARSKYDNASKLVKTGDISQERFNELEKAYLARRAGLEAARDELRTQWANLDALRAEVALAEKRRNDTVVRSPFDGIVGQRMVSPGQYIKENTSILNLVKVNPMRLRVEIPEAGVANVKPGTTLRFTTDALPGQSFAAVVRELNPTLDTRARSLSVEARLTGGDPRLRPGMFVQVQLVTIPKADVVAIPKSAVYRIAGLTKVFTIDSGKAKEHKFVPGQDMGDWLEVPAGVLQPGAKVATSNLAMLTDGMQVRQ